MEGVTSMVSIVRSFVNVTMNSHCIYNNNNNDNKTDHYLQSLCKQVVLTSP
jgi:hypothetical protein